MRQIREARERESPRAGVAILGTRVTFEDLDGQAHLFVNQVTRPANFAAEGTSYVHGGVFLFKLSTPLTLTRAGILSSISNQVDLLIDTPSLYREMTLYIYKKCFL